MTRLLTLLIVTILGSARCLHADGPEADAGNAAAEAAQIGEVKKIWDAGKHNAFTDLVRFRDQWFCCFREAAGHVGGDGAVRVLVSPDGEKWESAAVITEKDVDLRDPKFSVTPDGRLMVVAGGSVYLGTQQLKGRQPRVMFSPDGREWSAPQKVLAEGDWLWRVTWDGKTAYGASYSVVDAAKFAPEWTLKLYRSNDGVRWDLVAPLEVTGRPNETTLRVLKTGEMVALVRREAGDKFGWVGVATPPFDKWEWKPTKHVMGGPNFIEVPGGLLVAGSRDSQKKSGPTTVIATMGTDGAFAPILTLPSGGDTSYPGLVFHDGLLWVSYYSSHEGKSAIYLAKVKLPT